MHFNWDLVFGAILIVVGFVWIQKRIISVDIEGEKPLFYVKGKLTVFFGGILVSTGALI